ncbi:Zn-ribbon domain-containing OB-fold protein [Nocardioides marmoribigeumensis]|uniref:OB-fold protein n=1 Tax=Nocardioides marmoribigeumensis TaxID=433649 RepID=A0ABU2BYR4_9ACTN|nr:OB-fold domain-containing protein [Nocardioides marmoribigeumensis]MDR7363547.1 putative OB-fold protein [Nocardioides marmoribigeumensis]
MATPVVEGWFTTGSDGEQPSLLGGRCTTCGTVTFPAPTAGAAWCPDPACPGAEFEQVPLSRRGTVWSYTDARYQPPPPYLPPSDGEHVPFALAAVELAEGIVVLGQVAEGWGVDDLRVGSEVELVVEPLYTDESGERLVWRWKPVTELGEEADQ